MGFSAGIVGFPASCFNANKHFFLGWYNDRTILLNMKDSWRGPVFAFVDYDKTSSEQAVIVKVGNHIYLQYNRAREFNVQTRKRPNEVVIVYNENSSYDSNLLGGVSVGNFSTFRFVNYEGTGYDLVIQACKQEYGPPDFVLLSIWLDNGIQASQCNSTGSSYIPSSKPTPSPTSSPTQSPTQLPTQSPTQLPTQSPTQLPTQSPTYQSSAHFSIEPTIASAALFPRIYCNDSTTETFYIDDIRGIRRPHSCEWLAEAPPAWQHRLCRDHQARFVCPETCDACHNYCNDSKYATFYVNKVKAYRNCAWLANRPKWQRLICYYGHAAFNSCKESCGNC